MEDFKNQGQPIEINFQLKLGDVELGNFKDLFDCNDYSLINILAKQENTDEYIEFFHKETNTAIPASAVKCINFIHYDSLRNPITEINFDKGRGVGKFLRNIISRYLKINGISDKDFIEPKKFGEVLKMINGKISKIKSFKDFDISASADDDIESLLSKLIILKDAKGDSLTKAGYGVQFLILVTLSILEQIQFIKQQRKDRAVFENPDTGEKAISLVIGLDEPEIHLHPYMQRTLIKYLDEVINNKNSDFQELIKDLFDIDKFIGQIIVATHSPNIILNDYHQIIRFYLDKQKIKIKCGSELKLPLNIEKHLYLHFPFIKEAFFSRCAIFVEGDSEYASLPLLGEKVYGDFDDLGICVIQANGESVPQLIEIANCYGIPSVGITDKDNGDKHPKLPNHYQTYLRDFEEEIISLLLNNGQVATLKRILIGYDHQGEERTMVVKALNTRALRYQVVKSEYTSDLKLANITIDDIANLKSYYLTWFSINKSYPLGKLIGEILSTEQIPEVYKAVITKAHGLAKNV
jgi:putative ATP-dependent endonuclease of OLD family